MRQRRQVLSLVINGTPNHGPKSPSFVAVSGEVDVALFDLQPQRLTARYANFVKFSVSSELKQTFYSSQELVVKITEEDDPCFMWQI